MPWAGCAILRRLPISAVVDHPVQDVRSCRPSARPTQLMMTFHGGALLLGPRQEYVPDRSPNRSRVLELAPRVLSLRTALCVSTLSLSPAPTRQGRCFARASCRTKAEGAVESHPTHTNQLARSKKTQSAFRRAAALLQRWMLVHKRTCRLTIIGRGGTFLPQLVDWSDAKASPCSQQIKARCRNTLGILHTQGLG